MKKDIKGQLKIIDGYVYFGTYPQTSVTDKTLVLNLTLFVGNKPNMKSSNGFTSYKYYGGKKYNDDYIPSNDIDYMWYKDITYNNEKYRCVYFDKNRPTCTNGEFNYDDIKTYLRNTFYFFKFEPIKWNVISDTDDTKVVLVSDLILDSQCFNVIARSDVIIESNSYSNNYAKSFVRHWLNNDFYNTAFSDEEKNEITSYFVNNSSSTTNSYFSDFKCNNTYDKIWLLSYEETFYTIIQSTEKRIKESTDYAKCQGLSTNEWWTRSAYSKCEFGVTVAPSHGKTPREYIVENGIPQNCIDYFNQVDYIGCGIVPALCLNVISEDNKIYSINYFDNKNVRLYLEPEEYQSGDSTLLPTLKKENYKFIGWYDGKNIINNITKDMSCDLVLKLIFEKTDKVTDYINNNRMYYRDGNNIYFGMYPQNLVTDHNLIGILNDIVGSFEDEDFISYKYYQKSVVSDYMWYKDITYNDEKYRCVIFDKFRTDDIDAVDTTFEIHPFFNDDKLDGDFPSVGTYYFYKFEPIMWNIIEEKNDSLTLMPNLILDSQDYNHFGYINSDNEIIISNNYEKSSIRHWLNDDFYNTAFNEYEQELINVIEIDNSASSTDDENNKYVCNNTFDKVWLLSYKEADNNEFLSDVMYSVTDYALVQGLSLLDYDDICNILLRSPSNESNDCSLILCDENEYNSCSIKSSDNGILPIINIKLMNYNNLKDNSIYSIKYYDKDNNEYLIKTKEYSYYKSINLPIIKKDGYDFIGWFDGKDIIKKIKQFTKGDKTLVSVFDTSKTILDTFDKQYKKNKDCIYFGLYPQSIVTNENLILELTKIVGKKPNKGEYNGFISYNYYVDGNIKDYMFYKDISYNNELYRCVYFNQYRDIYTVLNDFDKDVDLNIKYSQYKNGYLKDKYYFFKFEKIKWNILDKTKTNALLVTDKILDAKEFNYSDKIVNKVCPNNYKESSIRHWLNNDFYNLAFNKLEKLIIKESLVDNGSYSTNCDLNIYACLNTVDKVRLLSCSDVDIFKDYDNGFVREVTDYAKCLGAKFSDLDDCGWFWLRSPNDNLANQTMYIDDNSNFRSDDVTKTFMGVLPVIEIKL